MATNPPPRPRAEAPVPVRKGTLNYLIRRTRREAWNEGYRAATMQHFALPYPPRPVPAVNPYGNEDDVDNT